MIKVAVAGCAGRMGRTVCDAVRAANPDIQQFECSVFNGVYVTRDVDQQYLDYLDSLRNDDAKAVQLQNEVENLEMHNEG